jgi:endonuclease/exonuclease/phosphatase family metal-dependent hydrolase
MSTSVEGRHQRNARKYVFWGILVVIGVVIGWYGIVRLLSPWTVVKHITLEHDTPASTTYSAHMLRVGCYNIAHGRGGRFGASEWQGGNRADKLERMTHIAHLFKTAQLDIVVLNEVDFSSVWSGHLDQAKHIAQDAGYPYLVEQRNMDVAIPFASVRFGNAILSNYPISEPRLIDFPSGYSRWLEFAVGGIKDGLVCTVHLPDGSQVRVVAVHLAPETETIRVQSARMILKIQQASDLPLMALGDFNAAPTGSPEGYVSDSGENTIDLLRASTQLTTQPMGTPVDPSDFTFPSEHPNQAIDWIFISPPWQFLEKLVLSSNLSDHLPVIAQLHRD